MTGKMGRDDGATLVDKIVDSIRDGIKEGRFVPGQRLVEADLTQQFDVSRGPLREAMRRLSSEGLVAIEPHKGAVVRKLSREDVREIFTVREQLEGLAARLAAEHINLGDNRKRLTGVLKQMQKHCDNNNIPAYMTSNEALHDLVVEISGNRYLRTLVSQLRIPLYRYQFHQLMNATSKRQSMADHKAVAAAILEGNPRKAERLMRKHVSNGCSFVETLAEL